MEIAGFLGGWHGGYVFFFVVVVVVVVVVAGVRGKGMLGVLKNGVLILVRF